MDTALSSGPGVRTALRFVSGAELAGAFRAADLVVLPYREIDQSGVLFTALAFGSRCCSRAVGGFRRSPRPALRAGPAGRPGRAGEALTALLADGGRRSAWPPPHAPPTAGTRSRRTLALYSGLQA